MHELIEYLELMALFARRFRVDQEVLFDLQPGDDFAVGDFIKCDTGWLHRRELGRPFVGIEQDREYCRIARARIAAARPVSTSTLTSASLP